MEYNVTNRTTWVPSDRILDDISEDIYPHTLQVFLFVVHSILVSVTLLANASVIWAFTLNWKCLLEKPRLKTNAFLLNLAIFDFLVAFFTWPLSVLYKLLGRHWFLGPFLCHLWIDSDYLLTCGSVLNVAMLSLDRYLGMKMTAKYTVPFEIRNRVIYCMIGATWAIPLALYVPINEFWDLRRTVMLTGGQCAEPWQDHEKTVWIVNISIFLPTLFCLTVPYTLLIVEVLRLRRRRSEGVRNNIWTQASTKRFPSGPTIDLFHWQEQKQQKCKAGDNPNHRNCNLTRCYHLDLNESFDIVDDSSLHKEKHVLKHVASSLSEYDMRFRSVVDVMGRGNQPVVPEVCLETAGMRLLKQPSRDDWAKIMASQNLKVVQGEFNLFKGGFEIEVECVNKLKVPSRFRSDSTLAASPQIQTSKGRRSFVHNLPGMKLNASRITQTISNLFTARDSHFATSNDMVADLVETKSSDILNFSVNCEESHFNSSASIGQWRSTYNSTTIMQTHKRSHDQLANESSKSRSSEVNNSALTDLNCKLNALEKLAQLTAGRIKQLDTYFSSKFTNTQSKFSNQLKTQSSGKMLELEQQAWQPGTSNHVSPGRVRRHGVYGMNVSSFYNSGYEVTLQQSETTPSNFSPIQIHIEVNEASNTGSERKLSRSACCLELMESNSEGSSKQSFFISNYGHSHGCSNMQNTESKDKQPNQSCSQSFNTSKEGQLDLYAINEASTHSSKDAVDRRIKRKSGNSNELAPRVDFGIGKQKRYSLVDIIQQLDKRLKTPKTSHDLNERRNVDRIREEYKRKLLGSKRRNSLSEGDHKLTSPRTFRGNISHFRSTLSRRASTFSGPTIKIWVTTPENAKFVGHVIVLVATCLICWLPYCIISTAHWTTNLEFDPIVFDFVVWLVYLNSLLNPFLYLSQNRLVRKAVMYSIKRTFLRKPKCFRLYLWEALGCLKPLSDGRHESHDFDSAV